MFTTVLSCFYAFLRFNSCSYDVNWFKVYSATLYLQKNNFNKLILGDLNALNSDQSEAIFGDRYK